MLICDLCDWVLFYTSLKFGPGNDINYNSEMVISVQLTRVEISLMNNSYYEW